MTSEAPEQLSNKQKLHNHPTRHTIGSRIIHVVIIIILLLLGLKYLVCDIGCLLLENIIAYGVSECRFAQYFWKNTISDTGEHLETIYLKKTTTVFRNKVSPEEFYETVYMCRKHLGMLQKTHLASHEFKSKWTNDKTNENYQVACIILKLVGSKGEIFIISYLRKEDGSWSLSGFDIVKAHMILEKHSNEKDHKLMSDTSIDFPFSLGKNDFICQPEVQKQ